jgi:hypothetical protein
MVQLAKNGIADRARPGLMRRCSVLAATAFPSIEADCSHR